MKDILEICCGLDVHKDTVVACLLKGALDGKPSKEIRIFSTLLPDLESLKLWLEEEQCQHVAMESTGVYWKPIYTVLEGALNETMDITVTNASHMKNVPGKKTDIKDAEWIATLLRAGLLSGSFIAPEKIRELRELTRYRKTIVYETSSQKNRIEKFLQTHGFKLSSFLTDIFGVSGRAIISRLSINGVIHPSKIEQLIKGRAKCKTDDIKIAVNGKLLDHQREFLKILLKRLEEHETHLNFVQSKINNILSDFQPHIQHLDTIPGVDVVAATAIIGEIGTDMSAFKTAEHICSWAGLTPGNNESAGKKKSSRVTQGNSYIKTILCEVAWSITRKRDCYLSSWYWKVKQRRGAKKAIIALARKVLVIVYNLLKNNTIYNEDSFENIQKKQVAHRKKRILAEAKKLGLNILEVS